MLDLPELRDNKDLLDLLARVVQKVNQDFKANQGDQEDLDLKVSLGKSVHQDLLVRLDLLATLETRDNPDHQDL